MKEYEEEIDEEEIDEEEVDEEEIDEEEDDDDGEWVGRLIEQEEKELQEIVDEWSWKCPKCSTENKNNIFCYNCSYLNDELYAMAGEDIRLGDTDEEVMEVIHNKWDCPNCKKSINNKHENYADAIYCENCGHVRDEADREEIEEKVKRQGLIYCVKCEKFVEKFVWFCQECGLPFKRYDFINLSLCPECYGLYHDYCHMCGYH